MEYTKTWASMEGMVAAGKCKSIGVSNFTIAQLEHLRSARSPALPSAFLPLS